MEILEFILNITNEMGYIGILIAMFFVFTFVPLPSQPILISAGYLAFLGELNLYLVILAGSIGGFLGANFNYFFAKKYGRPFILKYGKYFLISEKRFIKVQKFFKKYGSFSIFIGLLTPAIGQLITIPAGVAKMKLKYFIPAVILSSFIWNSAMVMIGYFFGEYQNLLLQNSKAITIYTLLFITTLISLYILWKLFLKKWLKSKSLL